ncbi:FRIGIDA-like protein 3 [Telopea speciosissima]|uniref:FRIGIDA-like protein 3 n=1 Tax=Telopea speciosissima TaxID=54955 RepID=UPI001CC634DC|nr:FRIGIDA-like protein 3 [Telopea speciosissima]XP_043713066.1 FRIGIDA-like protein 3 [Telopea speciosissima]
MADAEPVVAVESTTAMVEQLGKAFVEFESYKDSSEDTVQWKEIEEYFCNLEGLLKKRSDELEEKEKEFEEKQSQTITLLAERETVVAAKEQALLDRVQEIKDAAAAAIAEAREKYRPPSPEAVDVEDNAENKVSSSFDGDTNSPLHDLEEKSPYRSGENADGVAVEVKPRPELTQFCEQMDAKGLLNFVMENRKNLVAIREEISLALRSATDPAHLVLGSLEGFYPPDQTTHQSNKKDAALQGMRRSCVMLMEAVAPLLAGVEPGADHPLSPEIKQQAKAIADNWKPKLAGVDIDAANGNSLEAEAFLQLLATFRIASEFDDEELCKLVLAVARRRQAPELCRSLGLTHKMPGVVESLVSSGRQIDAVHLSQAFQLSESFPPVPLLKTYLKDLRRNSQGRGNSGGATGPQIDVNAQELGALRAVIRCVEEYKLEAEYPLDPLQKRVAQLEKSKADKKRMGDIAKHQQPKRARANGGFFGPRGPVSAVNRQPPVFNGRGAYMGVAERYPHAGPTSYDYQVPSQGAYTQQTNAQRPYYYPQDERATASTYSADPSNYGAYMGSGLQSSQQTYM